MQIMDLKIKTAKEIVQYLYVMYLLRAKLYVFLIKVTKYIFKDSS